MILGPQRFEDVEYYTPYKLFRDNNVNVDIYSTKIGKARSSTGRLVEVGMLTNALDVMWYDAIAFIGGAGTWYLREDKNCLRIAIEANAANLPLGAICWSTTVLAKAGVLDGKKVTGFDGLDYGTRKPASEYLISHGAKYTGHILEIDSNIITARDPGCSLVYGKAILEASTKYSRRIQK